MTGGTGGAVCADPARDPRMWFRADPDSVAAAKTACRGCPIRESCLRDALARRERAGVWGGLTKTERDALTRPRKATEPALEPAAAACGSTAGAKAHRARDEPVCDPCKAAVNAYKRDLRRRRRAERGIAPPVLACGTLAAARRHHDAGEPLDPQCMKKWVRHLGGKRAQRAA